MTRCFYGKAVPVIGRGHVIKNILVFCSGIIILTEFVQDRIIPEGTEAHNSVRNFHIAQSLADNVCLNRHLSLPAHLGTAGIDQHVHHKISGICLQLSLKDFGITASPDPPQS